MLTLLKKRQARDAVKAACEEARHAQCKALAVEEPESVALPVVGDIPNPLASKSWDEIQRMLEVDLGFVRTLAGFEEKNAFREELIKKYNATAVNLLATKKDLEGLDLLWWYFLWQVDCGRFTEIFEAFRAAVLRGLSTPLKWNSNGQVAFCDIVFKHSHAAHKASEPFNPVPFLTVVKDITSGKLAVNAALKVKVFRLAGELMEQLGKKKEALAMFELVMQIDPNRGGCKTRVKELTEELSEKNESENS